MVQANCQKAQCATTVRTPVDLKNVDTSEELSCVNSIRCLGAAMPTQAKSGHPGAPIGCAPMAHCLFAHSMRFDPTDDKFLGRDRFILSNGHACALLYSMLYLTSDHLKLQDLRNFRQLGSLTPGHPEANHTKGVEVTTGPLGQGIAQAVGMALGQHQFREKYGPLFDNYTFCIVGDGCLMEGVSGEASSLAGHLGLGRLICLYDANSISIDGSTDLSFTEEVVMRYKSYGFQIIVVENGDEDLSAILAAIDEGKSCLDKPTMIVCKTTIGYKTILEGTAKVHGSPLAADEITRFRGVYGHESEDIFDVGTDVVEYYKAVQDKNASFVAKWKSEYSALSEEIRGEIEKRVSFDPEPVIAALPKYTSESKPAATRILSGEMLNIINPLLPGLIGGSADLTPSNMTALKGEKDIQKGAFNGKYIRFGVREHAMTAICNGLFAHGGFRSFSATFMMFVSYLYPALRLSALSKFGQLVIATHDSIELGEDGPTHQPVEMLPLLRSAPGTLVVRPCDGNETAGCYAIWLRNQNRPTVASLSRGNVNHYDNSSVELTAKGAYTLIDFDQSSNHPKMILAASGAEVQLVVKAKELLSDKFNVRIVSFPCWELFEEQNEEYRYSVLPKDTKAFYVECSSGFGLEKYFCVEGSTFMKTFGASAPKNDLFDHFGFTPEKIARKAADHF